MEKVALYKGKQLEEYNKEKLIEIINHLYSYYEDRISCLKKDFEFIKKHVGR